MNEHFIPFKPTLKEWKELYQAIRAIPLNAARGNSCPGHYQTTKGCILDHSSGTDYMGPIPSCLTSLLTSAIASLALPPHRNLLPRSLETSFLPNSIASFLSTFNLIFWQCSTVYFSFLQQSFLLDSVTLYIKKILYL